MIERAEHEEGGAWERQRQFLEERLPDSSKDGLALHAAQARIAALMQMRYRHTQQGQESLIDERDLLPHLAPEEQEKYLQEVLLTVVREQEDGEER